MYNNPQIMSKNSYTPPTFSFTRDMFRKANKKDLDENDVYDILTEMKSSKLGDKLERQWLIDKTNNENPTVLSLLYKCYGLNYLFWGIIQLMMKISFV